MTVKETLNGYDLPLEMRPIMQAIDFSKLESFVSLLVSSLINKYTPARVKREIDDDLDSVITGLLTYFIEVVGIKIICDNNLETTDEVELQNTAFLVAIALNISLANELNKKVAYNLDAIGYYTLDILEILTERLAGHILEGNTESHKHFEYYTNDMVKTYLFNKL